MQERDVLAFGAKSRPIVDEPNAGGAATLEGVVEVIDDKAQVVNSRAPFGDELADR